MNNFKKIGLTALAGSLVATSAYAGEMSVSGGASFNMKNWSNVGDQNGKSMSMGNQLTFTGGGELDNGMNVATFIPLSSSPPPVKVNWLPIDIDLPFWSPTFDQFFILNDAPPETDISPAYAEVATKEPANAVSPIFLKLFILITPYCLVFIINNKRGIFTIKIKNFIKLIPILL